MKAAFKIKATAALLCLLGSGFASAELVDMQWSADGTVALTRSVAPGKFVELCGALAQGQKVQWQYSADAALDFNIHYHLGKDVVYPAQLRQSREAKNLLSVAVAQDYCWMWVNKGKVAVALSAELKR